MPDLLVITPHFPSPDYYPERSGDPRTKFLLDLAIAWTNQGSRVHVIHLPPRYPRWFNILAAGTMAWPGLRKLPLQRFVQDPHAIGAANYAHLGIRILRRPIPKYLPHRDYPARTLNRITREIIDHLLAQGLKPDIILADYLSPSLTVANALAGTLRAPVFPIIHQTDLRYLRRFRHRLLPPLQSAPAILYRSAGMARRFDEQGLANRPRLFLFSGIPDTLETGPVRRSIHRLLYVGTLRKSKNIHHTLHAIAELQARHPRITLDIVGSGEFEQDLREQTHRLGLVEQVNFHGKRTREQVFTHMRQADALIMVSKESFGMVYIEAMSQGCIVVAAQGEGIDGIVQHQDNGLLVPLDDPPAFTRTLDWILSAPAEDIARISTNAIHTATRMRDSTLARDALDQMIARTTTCSPPQQ
ncbi:MAG TPA: glycosyltransferase family 4 protein [Kiritimatiellia bacterium]|nr:glycosyltransferase family 4 protein [Kiritimatiellia bacterium]